MLKKIEVRSFRVVSEISILDSFVSAVVDVQLFPPFDNILVFLILCF